MRRTKLVAHLLHNDCILLERAKHSIYRNLLTGVQTSVPDMSLLKHPVQFVANLAFPGLSNNKTYAREESFISRINRSISMDGTE